ncbi:hypothetical protein SAMN04489716_2092 [Actinoplanes derwentensis]|uniref:Uncharacterized protein n=1 Tax=Actinoplanes derwentensis TaxID=113562 RepID=A0A1H1WID1_9ACTN|nr:hypothetical protein SAMN04489716_2092 [Actinoplanes derwentensis]
MRAPIGFDTDQLVTPLCDNSTSMWPDTGRHIAFVPDLPDRASREFPEARSSIVDALPYYLGQHITEPRGILVRSFRTRARLLTIVAAIAVFLGLSFVTMQAQASVMPLNPQQFVFFRG